MNGMVDCWHNLYFNRIGGIYLGMLCYEIRYRERTYQNQNKKNKEDGVNGG